MLPPLPPLLPFSQVGRLVKSMDTVDKFQGSERDIVILSLGTRTAYSTPNYIRVLSLRGLVLR